MRFHRTAMIVAAAGTLPFVVACSNSNNSSSTDGGVDSSVDGSVIVDAGSSDSGLDSGHAGDAGDAGDAGVLSDAQIVGVVQAINDGEIMAAHLALTNTTNFPVQEFASRMITDHTAANDELLALYNDGGLDGGFTGIDAGDAGLLSADASADASAAADGSADASADAGVDGGVVATSALELQIMTMSQQMLATLTPLMGDAFDTAYATGELQMHEEVLNIIDTQLIPAAMSPELKSYLMAFRAVIMDHIQLAQELVAELGDSGAGDAGINLAVDGAVDGGLDANETGP